MRQEINYDSAGLTLVGQFIEIRESRRHLLIVMKQNSRCSFQILQPQRPKLGDGIFSAGWVALEIFFMTNNCADKFVGRHRKIVHNSHCNTPATFPATLGFRRVTSQGSVTIVFPNKIVCAFLISPVCLTCHHSIYLHFLALRMFTEHYKLRKTFEFFPSSCHFPIRRSTSAPQHHVHKLYQLFYHRLRLRHLHRRISTVKLISLVCLCPRH